MRPFGAFRTQQPACDGCTTWKWACFRSGAKFEPLSRRLQPGIRFFHDPIPPRPTGRLAASLPLHRSARADGGAYHVPLTADIAAKPRMPIRLGSVFPGTASIATCSQFRREQLCSAPFWLWPDSRFGHSMLTRVHSTIHVGYPCGTGLVPRPPSCWQSPCTPSRTYTPQMWETLSDGLHTVPLPALHAILGFRWSHNESRHDVVMCDKAIRDIAALEELTPRLTTLHGTHFWQARMCVTSSRSHFG